MAWRDGPCFSRSLENQAPSSSCALKRPGPSLEFMGPCAGDPASWCVPGVQGPAPGLVTADVAVTAHRPSPPGAATLLDCRDCQEVSRVGRPWKGRLVPRAGAAPCTLSSAPQAVSRADSHGLLILVYWCICGEGVPMSVLREEPLCGGRVLGLGACEAQAEGAECLFRPWERLGVVTNAGSLRC